MRPATVKGELAFGVDQPTADPSLANVSYWFDRGGRRWVLDVLAPQADVAVLVDRVTFA